MTKIVVNRKHGGFGLSPKAEKRYLELIGKECYFYKQTKYKHSDGEDKYVLIPEEEAATTMFYYTLTKNFGNPVEKLPKNDKHWWYDGNLERTDPILIQVVEELGKDADGPCAELEIVEIPDDVEWEIDEYDGYESIHEKHRSW
jgi:hypothetical protein